jgi:hypothetical protein
MDEQHKPDREQRADEPHEQQDKPRGEQEQRPKDLDPKDQAKDVKGGYFRK